ncbi:DUF4157 domain-containing protein [Oscillatoria sp. HE19RPO]|uniref:eCIS core domain-containing protein n=1 Tax=Oscillatoria sp. HE19RPO TaxID=2954806 RepID=UPI0020C1D428|nr:DUF4157 domain-containing protein [Oscillatoria sp. HE19RPO]
MLPPSTIQPKLTIGSPNDRYEQQADTVARKVVKQISAPASSQPNSSGAVQRQAFPKPSIMRLTVQREEAIDGGAASSDLESSISQAKTGGMPLGEPIRRQMEGAFGANFSGVKVHTDNTADTLNRSLSARAFTTGNNIFFKRGEYNPGSSSGKELLAHELTHTIQQGAVQRQTSFPQPAPVNTLQNKSEVQFPEWKPARSFGNSLMQQQTEQVQRTLAPDEEAEFKKFIDLTKEEEKEEDSGDDTIQRSPDPSIQLTPQPSTPSLGNVIQRQGKSTLTPDKGDGKDITVVTRKGTWLGGASLTDKQKTQLKAHVKTAREYGAAAITSITALKTAFSTQPWEEIDEDLTDNFAGNFSGFETDPDKLNSLIDTAKQVMTRTNAGLSQPLKIVENHERSADTTKGYVKWPVKADEAGGLKSVSEAKATAADKADQIDIPFLDERIRPGSIHLQFGAYLSQSRKAPQTIYHEATHKFTSTNDDAGYGNRLAIQGTPPEKAIKNADCYAWYAARCE